MAAKKINQASAREAYAKRPDAKVKKTSSQQSRSASQAAAKTASWLEGIQAASSRMIPKLARSLKIDYDTWKAGTDAKLQALEEEIASYEYAQNVLKDKLQNGFAFTEDELEMGSNAQENIAALEKERNQLRQQAYQIERHWLLDDIDQETKDQLSLYHLGRSDPQFGGEYLRAQEALREKGYTIDEIALMAEHLEAQYNAEFNKEITEWASDFAQKGLLQAAIATGGAALLSPLSIAGVAEYAKAMLPAKWGGYQSDYQQLDTNSKFLMPGNVKTAARDGVKEQFDFIVPGTNVDLLDMLYDGANIFFFFF